MRFIWLGSYPDAYRSARAREVPPEVVFLIGKTGECLYIEVRPVKMPHQHFFHPKCHARRCDRLNTRCEAFYEKRIFDFHPLCLTISLKFHRSVLVFPIRHLNIHQSPLPHSIFVVIPSTSLKYTPIPNTSLDVYFNPHYLT
jgi:hypothetical protein